MAHNNLSIGAAETAYVYDDEDTYADGVKFGPIRVSGIQEECLAMYDKYGVLRESSKKESDIRGGALIWLGL